ncbi:MAG: PAS domain S-box protein, partial [Cyanobacteriota bacterium]|nr:PAS domain S-box protein [Cyanobacteriota bacterium]
MYQKKIDSLTKMSLQFEGLANFNQGTLDNMVDGILITDMKGRITGSNRIFEENVGQSKDKLLGKSPVEMLGDPDEIVRFNKELKFLKSEVKPLKDIIHSAKRKDNSIFPVSINISILKNLEGEPDSIIAVYRDVTDQKRAERALRKAHDELEIRVQERTKDFLKTNEELKDEIIERKQAEERLRKSKEESEDLSRRLNELNSQLR